MSGTDEGSEDRLGRVRLGPFRVDVTRRAGIASPLPLAGLARAVVAALDVAGAPSPASIGLILSDDEELAELNEVHLGHDGPTDVLSFPLLSPDVFPGHEGGADPGSGPNAAPFPRPPGVRLHLGDIVVSVERAAEQAAFGRGGQTGDVQWSVADEMLLLIVHGTLHVCGWDHAEPVEEAAMRRLEREILAGLGARRPDGRRAVTHGLDAAPA